MRIKNMDKLIHHGNQRGRAYVAQILEEGMQAADPYYNTLDLLDIRDGKLYIGNEAFEMEGAPFNKCDVYNREDLDRIFIYGAGKGALSVAKALEDKLGDWLTGGYVIAKHGDEIITKSVQVKLAAHPVPDRHCMDGCVEMERMIRQSRLTERDLVITIVGNGISALMTYPIEGLDIDDVKEVTRFLQIECGADTGAVNTVRNCIDRLKAGRISRMLQPAKLVHLFAIDVNNMGLGGVGYFDGWRASAINSVSSFLHTLPSGVSPKRALEVLKRYNAIERLPKVAACLERLPEEQVMSVEEFEEMDVRVYGVMPEHRSMPQRVEDICRKLGFTPYVFLRQTTIEASAMGKVMARLANSVVQGEAVYKAPCVLINYGEMIVTVNRGMGVGGRNQEFALSGAMLIDGSERIVMGAVDTDGTDGPGGNFDDEAYICGVKNLAGGLVDGYTMKEAAAAGVDVLLALHNHDTSRALWQVDSGIHASQCISINDIALTLIM
ncbi:MAG: DUF4147 domain-containing protein [Oscillospiraceae bacterium]|nr:DUF4147 domain-containing protein [Oscillospiraceae bacterium]